MENKEKQIEELIPMIQCETYSQDDLIMITKKEYDALKTIESYHIKSCGKGSVVLTEWEYEYFQKEIKHWQEQYHNENEKYIKFIGKTLPELLNNKSKETAEKYKVAMMLSIQEMQKYLELNEEQAKILYHHNSEIAKQFGDAIKE